jgi:hypothetical protein
MREGPGIMLDLSDWFLLATVRLIFTLLGGLKLWGLKRGIVGGADKPVVQRLCGRFNHPGALR